MATPRVLVIDDEQVVLDSVARVLSDDDFTVDVTSSSVEGLEWGSSRDYDLVITDIRMPEIDGMRILRDIRRSRPHAAVLVLTGYATVASAVQAMKLGAADYLEKPFTPEALRTTVRTSLARAESDTPDPQGMPHANTVVRLVQRATSDKRFAADVRYRGVDALDEYELTEPERLAILTGDIAWIESHTGKLTDPQREWLGQRSSAEI